MAKSSERHSESSQTFVSNNVSISLPSNLPRSTFESFIPYKTWLSTLTKSLAAQSNPSHPFHSHPYSLRSITVQSVDFFGGGRLGFLKFKARVTNDQDEHFPGSVFMRGGSVAMLIVLTPETQDPNSPTKATKGEDGEADEYVILTIQPRIPAGSLSFVELPAGMIDDSGSFAGAAAKEIKEETGLDINEDELINLSELAVQQQQSQLHTNQEAEGDGSEETHLQQGIYTTPGGSDEFMPIFFVRKTMSQEEMQGLKGKLTGLRDHGEKITLRLCRLRDLWKVACRDGKTLAAVALYEGLKREGRS